MNLIQFIRYKLKKREYIKLYSQWKNQLKQQEEKNEKRRN